MPAQASPSPNHQKIENHSYKVRPTPLSCLLLCKPIKHCYICAKNYSFYHVMCVNLAITNHPHPAHPHFFVGVPWPPIKRATKLAHLASIRWMYCPRLAGCAPSRPPLWNIHINSIRSRILLVKSQFPVLFPWVFPLPSPGSISSTRNLWVPRSSVLTKQWGFCPKNWDPLVIQHSSWKSPCLIGK